MHDSPIKTLLFEDDPGDFALLREYIAEDKSANIKLENVQRLEDGLELLSQDKFDIILVDLSLPDSHGFETFEQINTTWPEIPIIVLTANEDDDLATQAVKAGAQDYLVKGQFEQQLLIRSIRHALERHQLLRELKAARVAERFLAYRDNLTKLPNRQLFYDRLHQAILHSKRHKNVFAILFLDLDGFKAINDKLGHSTGDYLLKMAAERLKKCLRQSDTVSRWGGDEFTIILNRISQEQDAIKVAHKILESISQPFQAEEYDLFVTTSIGICLYPSDATDVEDLLKNADTAMYRAKKDGKNSFRCYDPSMNVNYLEHVTRVNSLKKAIEGDELEAFYQPQVNLNTKKIAGVEAFVRWRHPNLGLIPPSQFMPLAEETGLILQIDEWMLRQACAQNKRWQEEGLPAIRVSVNLSDRTFREPEVQQTLNRILEETGLEAKYLVLEITENDAMQNVEKTVERLKKFKDIGVQIALHQFGTGTSSLSCLKRLPKDMLKIDRSFVKGLNENEEDRTITKGITALAHSLDLKVIAEGVETKEQLSFLLIPGCDEVQGYLISRPVPSGELTELLKSGWQMDGSGQEPIVVDVESVEAAA
ncbi:EAL domain-containing protein [candidate division KSB1 bacterium]|nr:EAL domain-containing protein [candidate division KSB1 bacterium]